MVMRRSGHLKPRFFRAAWTRSPLSRTAESGRPTMERAGIPPEMSASTSTGKPLRPLRPKLLRTAYMGALLSARQGGGRAIKIFDLCCCIHLKKESPHDSA